jgi:hypothetical protein
MLRFVRHFLFLFSLAFVAGLARDARADNATAQALFDEGKRLMGEKKYAEACAKFEESQKLDPGLGTQTNLAICYESLGRTASAWSLYLEVAGAAKASNQTDREKRARDAAKALEPKLSKLKIEVTSPPQGLEVKRNGQLVGQATWGTPVPVDPGEIKITAMAPERKLWEKTLKIDKPGETTVTIPELEKGKTPDGYGGGTTNPAPTATTPVTGFGGPPPPIAPPPVAMKRRSRGLFGGGIALVSVGSLATLIGGVWLAIAAGSEAAFGEGPDVGAPAGTLALGLVMIGGGSAMIVIGGKKVPANQAKLPASFFSPVPEVRVGLGSVEAAWQF